MAKYEVRLEFIVKSTDFANINVEADTIGQARIKAVEVYNSDNCPELDFWQSDYTDTELDTSCRDDWEVVKLNN